METMSTFDQNRGYPPFAPPLPRPTHAATVVAAFYLLMALSTPWIVRYTPGSESQVAAQIAERPMLLRCASAREYDLPCGILLPGNAPVTAYARLDGGMLPRG